MSTEALPLPDRTFRTAAAQKMLVGGILLLLIQGAFLIWLSRPEYLPSPPALSGFARSIGQWRAIGDSDLDPTVYELLSPDDYLNRDYTDQTGQTSLNLFIAYYKTQYKVKGAHDPKVCLPGSGFNPVESKVIQIPTRRGLVPANYFLVAKEAAKDVVVYWYQTHDRALTGDQVLHFRRLLETFTDNRTDMALVRVVVPVSGGDVAAASARATEFVQSASDSIMRQFPPRPATR